MVKKPAMPEGLLDLQLISSRTLRRVVGGVSRRTICKWVKAGIIPAPTLFQGSNYWRVSVIREWILVRFGEEAVEELERGAAA